MKKYIGFLCLVMTIGFCSTVWAQSVSAPVNYKRTAVFSPALFDSRLWNAGSSGAVSRMKAATQRPTARRTTVLRFESGVSNLTEEQKQRLMSIVRRIEKRQVKQVRFISGSRESGITAVRFQHVADFLRSNNTSDHIFHIVSQIVPVDAVTDRTNNVFKIIETN